MEKKKITLSVALAVRNEEQNLKLCLLSIRNFADEIVVVDGGSTDRTVEIAKECNAKVIQTDNPLMFHINKQKALDACRGDWILQLDADEIVTEELKQEIKDILFSKLPTRNQELINGYYIPRRNYFLGHWLRKGGQYPDNVIRLVKRGYARFPCKSVHEQIEIDGEVGYLKEPLLHYSYRTTDAYWKKADVYTMLTAKEMKQKGVKISFGNWFYYTVIKPMSIFINLFFRHKGFMDGVYGLLFSYYSALHPILSYKKYIAKQAKNQYEKN